MAAQRWILTIGLTAAISFLVACSNSNHTTTTSPAVSISLTPTTGTTTVGNAAGIQFTATVSNDPNSYGVDWAITCSATAATGASCGTLTIPPSTAGVAHTASGTAVTYTPPAVLYNSSGQVSGSMTVDVTAFATADHTQNQTTPVTISSYVSVLSAGSYVFQLKGSDANAQPYQAAGILTLDGNGNVTAGEETLNTVAGFSVAYSVQQGSGSTPSTYFVGPNGEGIIALNLAQFANTSVTLQQTFSLSVLSASRALLAEIDSSSGSGTFEFQDATAAATLPTGGYAFVASGTDSGGSTLDTFLVNIQSLFAPVPTALGGVFNIDNNPSVGSISGNGSVADQDYYSYNTKSSEAHPQFESCLPAAGSGSPSGSIAQSTASGLAGVVTIVLTGSTCFGTAPSGTQQTSSVTFTGYIVDAYHMRLIESDDADGTSGFLTSGLAVSQVSPTTGTNLAGTFTDASVSGQYVFNMLGIDFTGQTSTTSSSFTSITALTANGSGNLTSGITDAFYLTAATAFARDPLVSPSTYAVDTYAANSLGIGRVQLIPKFQFPAPKANLFFYLTGDGNPLVLYGGAEDPLARANGIGNAYLQTANTTFGSAETYGVRFAQQNGSENDGNGVMTSTISGTTGTLTGSVSDFSSRSGNLITPTTLLDTFTKPNSPFNVAAGTFLNVQGSNGPYVDYYSIDSNHGLFVETDLGSSTSSTSSQLTLGYFEACDTTLPTCTSQAAAPAKHASISDFVRKKQARSR